MKQKIYKFIPVALILCAANLHAAVATPSSVTPYIYQRSQSARLERQVIGVREIERELACSDQCWPGYIGSTFAFSKTFRSASISHSLFGDALLSNCCQALRVTGSGVAGRNNTRDLLADNFGLPTDFISTLNFNPRIVNVISDYQFYLRLDRIACGLWLYIHAPVVHTKWDLNLCEDVAHAGTANYVEGYFSPNTVIRANLLTTAGQYFAGATPTIAGETVNGLRNARISSEPCSSHTKTELSDLQFWLGYDLLRGNSCNFAVGLVVAAPTGNRPEARYLFEPMVGNGRAWEVGGLVRGEYMFWENCDKTHNIRGFTQANITHGFKAPQRRTFDLKNNPLSRYALAQRLGANDTNPLLFGSTTDSSGQLIANICPDIDSLANYTQSDYKFVGEYTPVANLTTFCVDVSVNYQVDWVAMLTWTHRSFTWDIGYNLWSRGCEKISTKCCEGDLIAANTWALKGDAHVYGFSACTDFNSPLACGSPLALAATQSNSTVFAGTNGGSLTNPNVDNPYFAYAGDNIDDFAARLDASRGGCLEAMVSNSANNPIHTSIQPVFLSSSDIDICGAQTKGLSNSVFTHVSYWWDCECWEPYLGFGGEAEFASGHRVKCTTSSCNTGSCDTSSTCPTTTSESCSTSKGCNNSAVSQWSVWIKGGFVFG